MSAIAWIALGSNLGEREANLTGAVQALRDLDGVEVLSVSSWFETDPVGGPTGQPQFLNGALKCATSLTPRALLEALQTIEAHFGRDRTNGVPNGPRTLDLDLLLHGDSQVSEPDLTLPHPRIEERSFVLEPLAEMEPDLWLPRTARTVAECLTELRIRT